MAAVSPHPSCASGVLVFVVRPQSCRDGVEASPPARAVKEAPAVAGSVVAVRCGKGLRGVLRVMAQVRRSRTARGKSPKTPFKPTVVMQTLEVSVSPRGSFRRSVSWKFEAPLLMGSFYRRRARPWSSCMFVYSRAPIVPSPISRAVR